MDRYLERNKISQFILRIDLTPEVSVDFGKLAELLQNDYGSYRTELKVNFNVNVQTNEIKRQNFVSFNMGETPNVTLKLETPERAIILTVLHYNNKSVYQEKLKNIISALKSINTEIKAQRIGMRYINVFNCPKQNDISKVINTSEAKSINEALKKDGIARAMIVHEFQRDSYMSRIQCGIPNKFYPSKITCLDLVLDIDVYSTGVIGLDEWENSVEVYNHGAYDAFVDYTKESFRETLK